jgi:hypothetical protein
MKRFFSRLLAVAAALSLSVQSTGAASLPIFLMAPRAAFPPPAARFAAFPASRPAVAPAGPSWLESARVVSGFVLERVRQELDPVPAAAPAPAAAEGEKNFLAQLSPAPVAAAQADAIITPLNPGVASPTDRMMVVMEPGRRVEAVLRGRDEDFSAPPPAVSGPAPILKPYRERWQEQNGLRARVSYLRSHGLIHVDPGGFTAAFADGTTRHAASQNIPKTSFSEFPIYFHGEEVEIELTVVNKTGRTLHDVRLGAVQETFRPVGTEGARLAPAADVPVAKTLAPGQRVAIHWRTLLEGPAHAAVNLEQTHVRVTADGQAAPLLDAPQAGVIDPPGPGWH